MTEIVVAARALVGVRFRLHGRDPAHGLDCIGLVALALGRTAPGGYGLRGGDPARVAAALAEAGLVAAPAQDPQPGDILLMRPGAAQLHLGVRTATGLIHADAALGRVVERPGPIPWEVIGSWRRLF
ncbi:peptidoglycan endopeptidase [Sphingomonas changnyeongensis]|uniref:Peptidoglycan endopeptidase n=1 Tax=Sphingomonas changnyeongensis TaxID=2698679 RepID=A0A7Z2NVN6_9SPHN|nr:peptidoglycan endopeptidase [Sphingomonas changnyeongensis]QHL90666.1 peptidoglycan endopeptidase [Sphingomonas changnyeongensis]